MTPDAIDRHALRAALAGLGYADVLRRLPIAERAAATATPLRVAILRSYTVEPIEPVLRLGLIAEGYNPTCWFGGYNQFAQDIMDPASGLHAFKPDLVLLMVRLEELMPDFMDGFAGATPAEWQERVGQRARDLGALLTTLATTCRAPVVVQGASLLAASYFGAYDAQHPDGQAHLVQAFNRELSAVAAGIPSAFVWDFDGFVRSIGATQLLDPKSWYVARNPYRQAAYPAMASHLLRTVASALGRQRKCVVVDLDNTLWGGVAGEDGLDGVRLGHVYPGNCYRDLQAELLRLYHRGILLAINSKNNEADAWQIIEGHPDMVLRREHFAATRLNTRHKASNLRELAAELNVGLDTFVFVDDNPAECELVRRELPECDVVQLPDKPYLLPAAIRAIGGVENVRLTAEDRHKGEMYRARAARAQHEEQYADLEGYLASLDIEVRVEPASSFSIPRIAQLTQKTNQFNMTTRRYTEGQIEAFATDDRYGVFSVASRDRFGDDGIVGVCIVRIDGTSAWIDSFLLSCRVIGRGIEQVMISIMADFARARGAATLIGEFLPTAKNAPAAGLYERVGFQPRSATEFAADLHAAVFQPPTHIRVAPAEPARSP